MKNFKITAKEDNKEYWISRSIAVVGIVYAINQEGELFFLVSKRGNGCPDYVGKWQVTCGYLDFDETTKDAVIRELYEELGLVVNNSENVNLYKIIDDPKRDSRQNVSFRYIVRMNYSDLMKQLTSGSINIDTESRGGEDNEVDDIRLISSEDVENYSWAFNHEDLLKEVRMKIREDKLFRK